MIDLKKSADIAVRQCLYVEPTDKVLIVTDAPCREVGYSLFDASKEVTNNTVLVEVTSKEIAGTTNVAIHVDGLIKEPNLWVDGKQIMKRGEFLI